MVHQIRPTQEQFKALKAIHSRLRKGGVRMSLNAVGQWALDVGLPILTDSPDVKSMGGKR